MKAIKLWTIFKDSYRTVTHDNKLHMAFVSGNVDGKTLTIDRFERDYQIVEKLALGPEYYLVRNSANEYRIFVKIPGEPILYREVNEILIS